MPEQAKDLDAILGAALKEAGERGLLKEVSDSELFLRIVRLRGEVIRVLDETLETTEGKKAREVVTAYELWRKGSSHNKRPPSFQELNKSVMTLISCSPGNGFFIVPDLSQRQIIGDQVRRFYNLPEGISDLTKLALVKPAWILDPKNPDLSDRTKGLLVPGEN